MRARPGAPAPVGPKNSIRMAVIRADGLPSQIRMRFFAPTGLYPSVCGGGRDAGLQLQHQRSEVEFRPRQERRLRVGIAKGN